MQFSVTPPIDGVEIIDIYNGSRYKGIFKKTLVYEYYVELVLPYSQNTWMPFGERELTFPPDKKWMLYGQIFNNFSEIKEIISDFVIHQKLPDYSYWPANPC